MDFLIEIHFEDGFLNVESRSWKKIQIQNPELDFLIEIHYESFLDYVFYRKIRIPDFKNQNPDSLKLSTQISFNTVTSFWLA